MTEALAAVRTAAPDNSTGQEASRRGAPRGMGALHTQTKRLDYLISLKEQEEVWGRRNEVKSNSETEVVRGIVITYTRGVLKGKNLLHFNNVKTKSVL